MGRSQSICHVCGNDSFHRGEARLPGDPRHAVPREDGAVSQRLPDPRGGPAIPGSQHPEAGPLRRREVDFRHRPDGLLHREWCLHFKGIYNLRKFGSEGVLGSLVALSLIRGLGPVLPALIVTGRAGSALTAEIGIMRIGEQIDSLETMGIDPIRFLVAPRAPRAPAVPPAADGDLRRGRDLRGVPGRREAPRA